MPGNGASISTSALETRGSTREKSNETLKVKSLLIVQRSQPLSIKPQNNEFPFSPVWPRLSEVKNLSFQAQVTKLSVLSSFGRKDMFLLHTAAPKRSSVPQFGAVFLCDDNLAE